RRTARARPRPPAAATAVTPTSPTSMAATSPLHHWYCRRIPSPPACFVLVSALWQPRRYSPDAVGSQQPTPHKAVCSPPMGGSALAALPLTSAGFFLDTSVTLHYKKPTHRRPLTAAWRGDGAADGAHEYGVAVSLYAPGLGTDPTGSPSVCPHPPRRTDAAPRAGGSIAGAPAR